MYRGKGNTNGKRQARRKLSNETQARRTAQAARATIRTGHRFNLGDSGSGNDADMALLVSKYLVD